MVSETDAEFQGNLKGRGEREEWLKFRKDRTGCKGRNSREGRIG